MNTDNIPELKAAYDKGRELALNMLKVGNEFEGGFQIADKVSSEKDSLIWQFAMHGAMREIQNYRVYIKRDTNLISTLEPNS